MLTMCGLQMFVLLLYAFYHMMVIFPMTLTEP